MIDAMQPQEQLKMLGLSAYKKKQANILRLFLTKISLWSLEAETVISL